MKSYFGALVSLCLLATWPAAAATLDRKSVDALLSTLGADNQYDPAKGVNWSVLPGPFYTPELKLGLGMAVAGIYRVDPNDRRTQNSSLSFTGFVSSSGALGLGLNNYTFFSADRWRLFVDGSVAKVPTGFWGIGYDAAQGSEQHYTNNSLRLRPVLMREVVKNLYLGAGWDFSSMQANVDNPHPGDTFSRNHAASSPLSSGATASLHYDSRDVVTRPERGQFFKAEYTWFDPAVGSDSHFSATELQYDSYHLLNEKTVLAFDLWGRFTRGDVPWDMLSLAGDDRRLRGYYQGRYRDNDVVSGQIEYRRKLDWRHGYVLWIGAGALGDDISDLGHHPLLPTAGVGYRFEVKPAMNIRLDLGFGKESAGFYFQVAEAF
ncbi:BamA/TamA family outer membrane protein [Kluyvera cryocrescens]|uniref:BamA/TamA family outer membrane protein n=1 Tax=Kluyvera cryocrescens TaxID=580 RepID=UPI00248C5120|nr:BamA/TamA family outer membrane protein [Kluyvera cryocrescens]MEB6631894.1 BamA/TamA family outer membrane protein [Kluyvera cryocrescens]MEB7555631.1 BamA/TamA family outer membrane protein [Kluyvera cryocrescens]MEB7711848.1 BamA/TamA family outer membrane protein [Kluyvera cryocrescens]HDG1686092.1 BamA/TamA family outer membrane protein [Kluyvera cryocrescens]